MTTLERITKASTLAEIDHELALIAIWRRDSAIAHEWFEAGMDVRWARMGERVG